MNILKNINFKIFFFLITKKICSKKINNLKQKYFFLQNNPYTQLNPNHKKYFNSKKIKSKDISVLKYTNYKVQILRFLKIYFELKNLLKFKSILDLGCGVGYFQFICNYYGKSTCGIDYLVSNKYYNKHSISFIRSYQKILGIKCKNYKITKNFNPALNKKFDLITGFSANFDGKYKKNRFNFVPWTYDDYNTFFKNLRKFLKKDGKFFIKFNHKWEYKQNFYIDNKFKKYLKKNNLWFNNGIVCNFKPSKKLLDQFQSQH